MSLTLGKEPSVRVYPRLKLLFLIKIWPKNLRSKNLTEESSLNLLPSRTMRFVGCYLEKGSSDKKREPERRMQNASRRKKNGVVLLATFQLLRFSSKHCLDIGYCSCDLIWNTGLSTAGHLKASDILLHLSSHVHISPTLFFCLSSFSFNAWSPIPV